MAEKSNLRVMRDLGKLVHDERIAHGYSQQELSERTGLSRFYIGCIEQGSKNISLSVLRDISAAMKVKSWRMLKRAEEEKAA